MGVVLGLGVGIGLLLVWLALTDDPATQVRRPGRGGVRELMSRAGVEGVSPAAFTGICFGTGAVTGLVLLAVSDTAPVGAMFALLATYAPVALLRGRARGASTSSPRYGRRLSTTWLQRFAPGCPCLRR